MACTEMGIVNATKMPAVPGAIMMGMRAIMMDTVVPSTSPAATPHRMPRRRCACPHRRRPTRGCAARSRALSGNTSSVHPAPSRRSADQGRSSKFIALWPEKSALPAAARLWAAATRARARFRTSVSQKNASDTFRYSGFDFPAPLAAAGIEVRCSFDRVGRKMASLSESASPPPAEPGTTN